MIEKYLIYLLFATIAFIGIVVPFIVANGMKSIRQQLAQTQEAVAELIENAPEQAPVAPPVQDLSELRNIVSQPLEKLDAIEKRTRRLTERIEQIEQRELSNRQYDQAIRMIKLGTPVEEIMSSCGLNRGEVELIMVMNENDQDYKTAP